MIGSAAALVLAVSLLAAPSGDVLPGRGSQTKVSDDKQAFEALSWGREQTIRSIAAVPLEQRLVNYERSPYCREAAGTWVKGFVDGTCAPGADLARAAVECDEGDTMVMPLWRQERTTAASPWSAWTAVDPGGCGVDLLPPLTEADFRRLPLPAPTLTMQPDRGWVLINIETIVRTDPTPVTLRTELLGYGVTVEATPTRWTYDFSDGHTLTTTSPGHAYPDQDVFHEYEAPHDAATITLTAEWTGRYQVDGNPAWRTIDGTATTTAATGPFTVEERISRLVSGDCHQLPTPPDC